MSQNTLRLKTNLRSFARRAGLIPYLASVRKFWFKLNGVSGYEALFDRALRSQARPGDVIWDIGANLGLYTQVFADAVGPDGRVAAFEPTEVCFGELKERFAGTENVTLLNMALGAETGSMPMGLSDDLMGACHSLVTTATGNTVEVAVKRGEDVVSEGLAPAPNVIKVDVEGFEEEVLLGMRGLLEDPNLRAVLAEIHFSMLEEKGERHAPARIVAYLEELGFKVTWLEAEHIEAVRV